MPRSLCSPACCQPCRRGAAAHPGGRTGEKGPVGTSEEGAGVRFNLTKCTKCPESLRCAGPGATGSAPSLRGRGWARAARWGPGLAAPEGSGPWARSQAGWMGQGAPQHGWGCGSRQGSPNTLGNGVKLQGVQGVPLEAPRQGRSRGVAAGGGAGLSQGSAALSGHSLGLLPANSTFIHSTAPSPPQRTARRLPQSLDRLLVPRVNRFAVSQGTWVFLSPFCRR